MNPHEGTNHTTTGSARPDGGSFLGTKTDIWRSDYRVGRKSIYPSRTGFHEKVCVIFVSWQGAMTRNTRSIARNRNTATGRIGRVCRESLSVTGIAATPGKIGFGRRSDHRIRLQQASRGASCPTKVLRFATATRKSSEVSISYGAFIYDKFPPLKKLGLAH
jgi:hypothetical protein